MSDYSHRNGETELPTEPGWYWLEETIMGERSIEIVRYHISDVYGGYFYSTGNVENDHAKDCIAPEWWGPIVPPWNKEVSNE